MSYTQVRLRTSDTRTWNYNVQWNRVSA